MRAMSALVGSKIIEMRYDGAEDGTGTVSMTAVYDDGMTAQETLVLTFGASAAEIKTSLT